MAHLRELRGEHEKDDEDEADDAPDFVLQAGITLAADVDPTEYVVACAAAGLHRLVLSVPISRDDVAGDLTRYSHLPALVGKTNSGGPE